jgi:hypothetical protein
MPWALSLKGFTTSSNDSFLFDMKLKRYLVLAIFAAHVAVCGAEQPASEPPSVPGIRKACKSIDEQLVSWRTVQGKQSCSGKICDQMTVHAERSGRIRKIEQRSDFAGPGPSSRLGYAENLYYMDENEVPIFQHSKHVIYKQPDTAGLNSEIRYYFDQGNVAAYQKDGRWMSPNDPNWKVTTGTSRKMIAEQLDRARREISNIKLYHSNE